MRTTLHRTAARAAALATAAALMLAACGGSGDAADSDGSGEPVTGGTLVYLDKGTFTTLYPPQAGFYPNGGLVNNITDRLNYSQSFGNRGTPAPGRTFIVALEAAL